MKKNLIAIIPLLLGISFLVIFKIIGSKVVSDGTLVEPFWLLPIGYLLLVIGIIVSVVLFLKKIWKI